MQSWPRMATLGHSFAEYLHRLLLESFFPTACAEGVRVLFDRNAMIEARIRALPGYVEAEGVGHPWSTARRSLSSLWGHKHGATTASIATAELEGVSPTNSLCEAMTAGFPNIRRASAAELPNHLGLL